MPWIPGMDRVIENLAYGLGNITGLVSHVSPATTVTYKAVKVGARTVKAIQSFWKGGLLNPVFYGNSASALLCTTSLALDLTGLVCTPVSFQCYAASQCCGAASDAIDNCLGFNTYFF
jgi:hypothetical protein